ncbi:hypothetical protein AAFF_G00358940 [Aldrovandia affinis]|uniref:Uncharacterized protein n=1 Tax=Aldrovandia affinis TaxID=143900 RepID=A0AAD7SIL3_9TELE|nr:hypothetical protein AAFF_G00358940 [Aldrovandia affinis]
MVFSITNESQTYHPILVPHLHTPCTACLPFLGVFHRVSKWQRQLGSRPPRSSARAFSSVSVSRVFSLDDAHPLPLGGAGDALSVRGRGASQNSRKCKLLEEAEMQTLCQTS